MKLSPKVTLIGAGLSDPNRQGKKATHEIHDSFFEDEFIFQNLNLDPSN